MTVVEIKRIQQKRKKDRLIKRVICVAALICICFLIVGSVKGKERIITGYEYKSTETLWEFLKYCPCDMNRWEYLDLIMELNGMEDRAVRTDRLYMVPVFE